MSQYFANLLKSTSPSDFSILHASQGDFSFTVYGYQAYFVADRYYQTRQSLKEENGVAFLTISRKVFRNLAIDLIPSCDIHIWRKLTTNSAWTCVAVGKTGSLNQLESIIGPFDTQLGFTAALAIEHDFPNAVSFTLGCSVLKEIIIYSTSDDMRLTRYVSILLYYNG